MCKFLQAMFPVVLAAGLLAMGCSEQPAPFEVKDRTPRADRDAPFDPPNAYPEWAYDGPSYVRPLAELKPAARAAQADPLHYFTNKKLVEVRLPADYPSEEIPRLALWWTDNNGFHWHKAGHFGRAQTFFPFEVESDGDYGIRFVGPDQTPAVQTPAYPERVYHVDTKLPKVEVTVEPEQTHYTPGQVVTISWRAEDFHLIEDPVAIKLIMDFTAPDPQVVELQRGLAHEGAITYEISPEAAQHELRFRVEALDRANNLGLVYSHALQVVDQLYAEVPSETMPAAEEPAEEAAPAEPVSQAEPAVRIELASPETAIIGGDAEKALSDALEAAALRARSQFSMIDDEAEEASSAAIVSAIDTDDATVTAGEFALLGNGPIAVPFVRQPARSPNSAGGLAWQGPKPTAFPSGNTARSERRSGGIIASLMAAGRRLAAETREGMASVTTPSLAYLFPSEDAASTAVADSSADEPLPLETTAAARREAIGFTGESSGLAVQAVDLTHGNGLMIPLPATVEVQEFGTRLATAHPWRILGGVFSSPLQVVWSLPRPQFGNELIRLFDGRFLAENPGLRVVTEPGSVSRTLVGTPDEVEPPDLP